MFFETKTDALMYCKLEIIRTHKKHILVSCLKYKGMEIVKGWTIQLQVKK